jgi:hypothetical protein
MNFKRPLNQITHLNPVYSHLTSDNTLLFCIHPALLFGGMGLKFPSITDPVINFLDVIHPDFYLKRHFGDLTLSLP